MAKKEPRMVVVTTDKDRRGVFFGEMISQDGDTCVLVDAQMAVYWSASTHGVLGLAGIGPQSGSKITPEVPRIEVNGVTSIIDASPEAVKRWREQPWS